MNRYSEVRYYAQICLFNILEKYHYSHELIVDRIVQILDSSNEIDHGQIKVCLRVMKSLSLFMKFIGLFAYCFGR